jgi:DnaK suppressor protein
MPRGRKKRFFTNSLDLGLSSSDRYVDLPFVTGKERASFKKLLTQLEKELTKKGSVRATPNRGSAEEVGGDEDEQPLNEMMQAIASNRNRNLDGVLVRVRAALQKLKDTPDDFGLCEDCGDQIGSGRLKAMPYAEMCVVCQGKRDGPRVPATRKHLLDFNDG